MSPTFALAAHVSPSDANLICNNWIDSIVSSQGSWADSNLPQIMSSSGIYINDVLVGYRFDIEPSGYVVVPSINELAPVKSWSDTGFFNDNGFSAFVIDNLYQRVKIATQLTANQKLRAFPDAILNYNSHKTFSERDFKPARDEMNRYGPLLETEWHQDFPFNKKCPTGDGGRTFVGCTPLAAAQLTRYYSWPRSGAGTKSWWWDGDTGCDGESPGLIIEADYDDLYSWTNMPFSVGWNASQEVQEAVSELCFEMSVACNTEFS